MSPLWSDLALARAAWADAVARGIVDERSEPKPNPERTPARHSPRVRRLPRVRLHTLAL